MGCGQSGQGQADITTVVVNTCCGYPEPAGGWDSAVNFRGILDSTDITSGDQLTLYVQGTPGTVLAPPTASQRLYLFHVQVIVGSIGNFKLFEAANGVNTPSGDWATVSSGLLAKYAGIVMAMPNVALNLGSSLHASHSVAGRVTVTVHGALVNEV